MVRDMLGRALHEARYRGGVVSKFSYTICEIFGVVGRSATASVEPVSLLGPIAFCPCRTRGEGGRHLAVAGCLPLGGKGYCRVVLFENGLTSLKMDTRALVLLILSQDGSGEEKG